MVNSKMEGYHHQAMLDFIVAIGTYSTKQGKTEVNGFCTYIWSILCMLHPRVCSLRPSTWPWLSLDLGWEISLQLGREEH